MQNYAVQNGEVMISFYLFIIYLKWFILKKVSALVLSLGPAQKKKKKIFYFIWLLTAARNKKRTQNCSLFYEVFFFSPKNKYFVTM